MLARILYILLAILIFGVLIAIHEFGHFFTAKLLGVKVNEFAIGMGPLLFSRTRGETQYSLRALPIGGYCAMEGEDEDTGDSGSFAGQPAWKRIIILCAGSFMNFLMGLLIAVFLVNARAPVITGFADGFQVQGENGLMLGDRIVSVDGREFGSYSEMRTLLEENDGQGIDLVVLRDGKEIVLNDLPMYRMKYVYKGGEYVGFGLTFESYEQLSPLERVRLGAIQTVGFVRIVWESVISLVAGKISPTELSGVIGIVDVVSEVGAASETVAVGVANVFSFMSLIAVNLAVMNMLPIPALDGGRIFFILLNGVVYLVSRRRIPARYEGYVHTGAFVLLLALMVLVAFHDVWNIFA